MSFDTVLADKITEVIAVLEQAASIEKLLPDKQRISLDCKASWPDYVYDADDKKDQEPTIRRPLPTAKQIDLLNKALSWLDIIGTGRDNKTISRKRIIWAKSNKFSYRDIAFISGVPPSTVELWYKKDIAIIANKVFI
jgi:hypothetical protein